MIYKYNEAKNALEEFENIVFRGGRPKERNIKIYWDERYHAETEGVIDLHRDLADGKLKNVTACEIPF